MKEGLTAQIRAFFDEFPFIERYLENVKWISTKPDVKRIDLDLLDRFCWTASWSFSRSEFTYDSKRYFLIDSSGNELAKVRQYDAGKGRWFRSPEIIQGETIAQAIKRLDDPNKVEFILEITDIYGRENRESALKNSEYGLTVTVHKIPTGRTFKQWIEEIPLVAKEQLQKELANIDNV